MPSFLWFDNSALDLTARQYGGLAISVGAALAAQIIYLALSTFFIRTHNSPERRAFWRKERRRLDGVVFGTFIAVAILTGVRFLDLDADLEDTVNVAARVLGAVCAGLLLLRGIAIVGNYLLDKAALTETRLDDQLIPLVRQTANVFVVLVGQAAHTLAVHPGWRGPAEFVAVFGLANIYVKVLNRVKSR